MGMAISRTSSATPAASRAVHPRFDKARLIDLPAEISALRRSERLSRIVTLYPAFAKKTDHKDPTSPAPTMVADFISY